MNKSKQGTINIDPTKVIGAIRMLVNGETLNAIEICSLEGDILADCVFNTGQPDDLLAIWEADDRAIARLGFVLASCEE